jgi:hypothetical protein
MRQRVEVLEKSLSKVEVDCDVNKHLAHKVGCILDADSDRILPIALLFCTVSIVFPFSTSMQFA